MCILSPRGHKHIVQEKHSLNGFHVAPRQPVNIKTECSEHRATVWSTEPNKTECSKHRAVPCIHWSTEPNHRQPDCPSTVPRLAYIDWQNPSQETECSTRRAALCLLIDRIQSLAPHTRQSVVPVSRPHRLATSIIVLLVEAQFGSTTCCWMVIWS